MTEPRILIARLQSLLRDHTLGAAARTAQRDQITQQLMDIARSDAEAFTGLLRGADTFATLTAIDILSASGHHLAAEVLLPTLFNPMYRHHREALVRALARLQDPDVVRPLLDKATTPDIELQAHVLRALALMRVPEALEHFQRATSSEDGRLRAAGITGLGRLNVDSEHVIAAVSDPHDAVRAAVAEALGEFQPANTVEVLLPLLNDPQQEVRDAAALTLGLIGEQAAAETLRARLRGFAPPELLPRLTRALARLGDRSAVPLLIDLLDSSIDADVLSEAVSALGQIDPLGAIEPLSRLLRSNAKPSRARRAAGEQLSLLDIDRAVPPLLAVLRDNTSPVGLRVATAEWLGASLDRRAVLPLKMLIDHSEPDLAQAAQSALAQFGEP